MVNIPIRFLLPLEHWPDDVDLKKPVYSWSGNRFGKCNWIVQTFQRLTQFGFQCELTHELVAEGIVIAHRDVIPTFYRPHSRQLLVCVAAERGLHPYAQFQVLQNPLQARELSRALLHRLGKGFFGASCDFIRYWPQPGLIPRSKGRGEVFRRICFMGVADSLLPELQSKAFAVDVKGRGMQWDPIYDKEHWQDYSEVDAIVAVRERGDPVNDRKPATKLYNAWLAGIPAILGKESAFQHEGSPGDDYLEASSAPEVLECLDKLKEDPALRKRLVDAGRYRTGSLTEEALVQQWIDLIENQLRPLHRRWVTMPEWKRSLFFFVRQTRMRFDYLARQIRQGLSKG